MRRLTLAIVFLCVWAPNLYAQSSVRVIKDQAVIWQPGFTTMALVAKAGTVLEVVGRQGDWYEVVLPSPGAGSKTGMIAVSQVEAVGGPSNLPPPRPRTNQPPPRRLPPARRTGRSFRAFGDVGYGRFAAHQGFDAVLGRPGGPWFGGGAELGSGGGLFFQGSIERFRRTGERVFVFENDVFKLGIPDTITITPLAFTAGYRFGNGGMVPYLGGGVGRYFYKEESKFADPSENVDRQFTSYHVLGGVEWRGTGWIGTAFEAQYTHVPHDLDGGVLDEFDEHDLGGIQARVKILFGR